MIKRAAAQRWSQRRRDKEGSGGAIGERRAVTATKRGGRQGQCNNLTISHEERRALGGGQQVATATNRGGRWGRCNNLTII
jgi:hypothetical protein